MVEIRDLARSMQDRMPWPVGRRILEENEIARGRGWDLTLEKLSESKADFSEKIEPVRASLLEHILYGEKLVRLFMIEDGDREDFFEASKDIEVPNNLITDRFPLILTEEELDALPLGHTLIGVETTPEGVAVIFASIRNVSVRVPLKAEDFPEESADMISNFDEIVGVKNRRVQGMDVVWVPVDGDKIDVRVDYPAGMLQEAGEYAHARLREKMEILLGRDYLVDPINLFPLISRMYADKSEGSVVELAFGTTTASLKHEKMRRGSLSLRDEKYHKGGLAALSGAISPFKVSLEWERRLSEKLVSKPELNLHTTSYVAGGENPVLTDAIVRNCMGVEDYDFVRSRMLHHLDPPQGEA